MRFPAALFTLALTGALTACGDATAPAPSASSLGSPTAVAPVFALVPGGGTSGQIFLKSSLTFCADVAGSGTANGTRLALWGCGAATKTNQQFRWMSDGTIRAYGGGSLCVEDYGGLGKDGDRIAISTCTLAANQKWTATSVGEIKGINGKCIGVPSATGGVGVVLATCNGSSVQRWDSNVPSGGGPVDFHAIAAGIRPRGFAQGTYTLRAPVTAVGGRNLYVATTGNDANAGTASTAPFRTIGKAARVARAGDVVNVANGTYGGSVIVTNSGTSSAPIVFQATSRGGVVLTDGGASVRPTTWSGLQQQETGQLYVTLRGLTFRRYASNATVSPGPNFPAAVKAARGWKVEDCLFDDAGNTAVQIMGSYVSVLKSTLQNTYYEALAAWAHSAATSVSDPRYTPLDGIQVVDVILKGNFTRNTAPTSGGVADYSSKFLTTRGTLVDNVEAYANNGPGFWFDTQNSNFTVRNSYFHDNRNIAGTASTGRGLNIESNWATGVLDRNVYANNASMGLAITASQGITIHQSLFIDNPRCMELTNDLPRAGVFPLRNIGIYNNQCGRWTNWSGIQTIGGAPAFSAPSQMGIKADSNVYQAGTNMLGWWENRSIGAAYTIADFRTKWGWELHGRTGTVDW